MCITFVAIAHSVSAVMRTNIVIDEQLMSEALRLTGARTKRRVVEDSLRLMIRLKREERIRAARGKLKWHGDLKAMRGDR
jgi:Arc/MetJ family transcription regulator